MDYADFLYAGRGSSDDAIKRLEQTLSNYSVVRGREAPGPMQKVVVRFLQRKLIEWGKVRSKQTLSDYATGSLRDRLIHASLFYRSAQQTVEPGGLLNELQGWNPLPKASINLDFLDCFVAGDQDTYLFRPSDPLYLFFKLRYACALAYENQYAKAIATLEPATRYGTAAKEQEPALDHADLSLVLNMCQITRKEFDELAKT